jgi:hypothetical protein
LLDGRHGGSRDVDATVTGNDPGAHHAIALYQSGNALRDRSIWGLQGLGDVSIARDHTGRRSKRTKDAGNFDPHSAGLKLSYLKRGIGAKILPLQCEILEFDQQLRRRGSPYRLIGFEEEHSSFSRIFLGASDTNHFPLASLGRAKACGGNGRKGG